MAEPFKELISATHPHVLVGDDVSYVGHTTREYNHRRAAVWLESTDETVIFRPGDDKGEDVSLAVDDDTMYALWRGRSSRGSPWRLFHARCARATSCGAPEDWRVHTFSGRHDLLNAPDIALSPQHVPLIVFTDGPTVRFGWLCGEEVHAEIPDGTPGAESTERGQPSIHVDPDGDRVHIVYTKRREQTEIRIATRTLPTCP